MRLLNCAIQPHACSCEMETGGEPEEYAGTDARDKREMRVSE